MKNSKTLHLKNKMFIINVKKIHDFQDGISYKITFFYNFLLLSGCGSISDHFYVSSYMWNVDVHEDIHTNKNLTFLKNCVQLDFFLDFFIIQYVKILHYFCHSVFI